VLINEAKNADQLLKEAERGKRMNARNQHGPHIGTHEPHVDSKFFEFFELDA